MCSVCNRNFAQIWQSAPSPTFRYGKQNFVLDILHPAVCELLIVPVIQS